VDVRKFDYFLTVADLGSFSRAAASLHISQPVLSRQVRKLEDELGLALFYRNGRGVSLTQGGRCLVDNARNVQRALDSMISELGALKNQFAGGACIGMPSSVGRVLAVPLATHFRDHFPEVQLHIVEGFSGDIVERLSHGRLDIAITYASTNAQGIVVEPVAVEQLWLVSPPGTAPHGVVDMQKLVTLPLILPGTAHALRVDLERAAKASNLQFDLRLEVDSLDSMLKLVQAGLGHAVLPPSSIGAESEASGLVLTPVRCDMLERKLYIASGPQRAAAPPARRLANLVRKQMLDLAGANTWRPIAH
jgi:LysR family nitrogen assimilation transcriptional regulator